MEISSTSLLFFLETILFFSVVFLHVVKKFSSIIILYVLQSAALSVLLVLSAWEHPSVLLACAVIATIAVKVVVAPYFFFALMRKHALTFVAGTYMTMPITFCVITALAALPRAHLFQQFALLSPRGADVLLLPFATILISIFLIINRKGALSQVLGILSLENAIVSFALLSGLEQNPGLQIGITVNVFIWIFMATVLASMVYRHYGSLDVSAMKHLTE